ncbi:MAG: hypothetical protein WCK81_15645, partial [Betaproteobacteria bacterium]
SASQITVSAGQISSYALVATNIVQTPTLVVNGSASNALNVYAGTSTKSLTVTAGATLNTLTVTGNTTLNNTTLATGQLSIGNGASGGFINASGTMQLTGKLTTSGGFETFGIANINAGANLNGMCLSGGQMSIGNGAAGGYITTSGAVLLASSLSVPSLTIGTIATFQPSSVVNHNGQVVYGNTSTQKYVQGAKVDFTNAIVTGLSGYTPKANYFQSLTGVNNMTFELQVPSMAQWGQNDYFVIRFSFSMAWGLTGAAATSTTPANQVSSSNACATGTMLVYPYRCASGCLNKGEYPTAALINNEIENNSSFNYMNGSLYSNGNMICPRGRQYFSTNVNCTNAANMSLFCGSDGQLVFCFTNPGSSNSSNQFFLDAAIELVNPGPHYGPISTSGFSNDFTV